MKRHRVFTVYFLVSIFIQDARDSYCSFLEYHACKQDKAGTYRLEVQKSCYLLTNFFCLPTFYQLYQLLSTFLSTFINFYQLFYQLLSTFINFFINFYQLFIKFFNFYQLFINFYQLAYKFFINCLSTFYQVFK